MEYDLAIIGAGPAGLMTAIRASELGAKVVLLERNDKPGKKLLLTGKGRCNITNAEFDLKKLTSKYGPNGKFLFHAFSVFGPKQVMEFFENHGLKTKIERGNRVFPITDKAESVLRVLLNNLSKNKVVLMCNKKVFRIDHRNSRIEKVVLKDNDKKQEIRAKNYVLATGAKSYPLTGSMGDGFSWAKDLGHNIKEPVPSLVPIKIKEDWVKELQGLSLKNIEIAVKTDKVCFREFGECLFTHFGMSGPVILDIAKRVGELLKNHQVRILLDLKPALDFKALDQRIQKDFQKYHNKSFKNALSDLLPQRMIPVIIRLSRINPEKKANTITKEQRRKLTKLLKELEMTVLDLLGFNYAIATSGGICLDEIDHKTMKSKVIDNLFFAGEIIDIDGPTGGYNLQACWSTGYIAGQSAIK